MGTKKQSEWKWLTLKTGERVMVDADDYERLKKRVWILRKRKRAEEDEPQVLSMSWNKENTKISSTYLPREVMQEKGDKVVIRKNFSILDFRKSNLLVCSRQQKERMRPKSKQKYTSKYKGVSWRKQSNKWNAKIYVEKKHIHLGLFLREEDAALEYNHAAIQYFGEDAYINKIE